MIFHTAIEIDTLFRVQLVLEQILAVAEYTSNPSPDVNTLLQAIIKLKECILLLKGEKK